MKMLDKLKNYAEHYENEVRDISNQLRDEMMPELSRELFDEYEITGNRLRYEEGYFKRREFLSTFGLASVIWHKKEDIENLAVGDKITFHEEGAAWNQVVNNAVTSIEKNDEYHLVSINGGMEQPGGLDLKLEDDDTYRTMTFDDYPLYYEMGEKTMPLAEDVVLKDSSADPQAEAVETTGADAVAAAINADPDNWTTYNTTLVVQGGKVLEVRRIWVP